MEAHQQAARQLFQQAEMFVDRDPINSQRKYHDALSESALAIRFTQKNSAEHESAIQLQKSIADARKKPVEALEAALEAEKSTASQSRLLFLYESLASLHSSERRYWFSHNDECKRHSDKALQHSCLALALVEDDTADKRVRELLAEIRLKRFLDWGLQDDADDALKQFRYLLRQSPENYKYQCSIASCLSQAFTYTHDRALLNEAIDLAEAAFCKTYGLTDLDAVAQAAEVVVDVLQERGNADGCLDDIELSLTIVQWMLDLLPLTFPNRCVFQLLKARQLTVRFTAKENYADLNEAIDLCQSVRDGNSFTVPSTILLAFAKMTRARYEDNGDQMTFDGVRSLLFEVERACSSTKRGVLTMKTLEMLSATCRYDHNQVSPWSRSPRASDVLMKWAIYWARRAYSIARRIAKTWGKPSCTWSAARELAKLHLIRHNSHHLASDRQSAHEFAQRALTSFNERHSNFEEAAAVYFEATERDGNATPPFKIVLANMYSHGRSLSIAKRLETAHQICHKLQYNSDQRITYFRLALKSPSRHMNARLILANCLGNDLSEQAYQLRTETAFDDAIRYYGKEYSDYLQPSNRNSAFLAYWLGSLHYWSFHYHRKDEQAKQALKHLEVVSKNSWELFHRADALEKIFALRRDYMKELGSVEVIFTDIVDTVRDLMGYFDNIEDNIGLVRRYGEISENIACYALQSGVAPRKAFQYLQTAHNLTWESVLDDRSPVQCDEGLDESLRTDIAKLRLEKATLVATYVPGRGLRDAFARSQDYKELMKRTREIPAANGAFGSASQDFDLRTYLGSAPLVAIAESKNTPAQALILRNGQIESIVLHQFTHAISGLLFRLWSQVKLLPRSVNFGRDVANALLQLVLVLLWTTVTRPILDHLGYHGATGELDELPRLYWLSSGVASTLPLHLAGDYGVPEAALLGMIASVNTTLTAESMQSVLAGVRSMVGSSTLPQTVHDRVVSSYVPSVRAIRHIHFCMEHQRSHSSTKKQSALVVAIKDALDMPILDQVEVEARKLEEILEPTYNVIRDQNLAQPVISELEKCEIAHFACHSSLNDKNPFQSRICLQDYWWNPKSLTVENIMKMVLGNCKLVFLNMCDAAVTTDYALRNQGIHLPGSFHMAGIPFIVGTWYPVSDIIGPRMAEEFYKHCKDPSSGAIDATQSARALHRAMSVLRAEGHYPVEWGAYSHFGL